jgi:hypothetical protein
LQGTLDTTEAVLRRARALLEIPDLAGAAIVDGKKVADEDEARWRLAARVIEILSVAGVTCDLRHLGVSLQ